MLKKDEATYLGVDLGGTKLLIGEMTLDGRLLYTKKYPSGPLSQPEALEVICQSVKDFLEARPQDVPMPVAMGVGLVGRVNSREGISGLPASSTTMCAAPQKQRCCSEWGGRAADLSTSMWEQGSRQE